MKCSKASRHARKTQKADRAPAAITSLSAASRCASHPPRNPLVLPPKLNPVSNDWVLPLFMPLVTFLVLLALAPCCSFAEVFRLDSQLRPFRAAVQFGTKFVTLTVTFSVFLTSEATGLRRKVA
jgi:hypothetical protein